MSRRFGGSHNRRTTGCYGSGGKKTEKDEPARFSQNRDEESSKKGPKLSTLMNDWLTDESVKDETRESDNLEQNKVTDTDTNIECDEDFPSLSDVSSEAGRQRAKEDKKYDAVELEGFQKEKMSRKTEYRAWRMVNRYQTQPMELRESTKRDKSWRQHTPEDKGHNRYQTQPMEFRESAKRDRSWRQHTPEHKGHNRYQTQPMEFRESAKRDRSWRQHTPEHKGHTITDEDFPSLSRSAGHKVRAECVSRECPTNRESSECKETKPPNDKQWSGHVTRGRGRENRYIERRTDKRPSKGSRLSDYVKSDTPKNLKKTPYSGNQGHRGTTADKKGVQQKAKEDTAVVQKQGQDDKQKWKSPPKIKSGILTLDKLHELKDSDADFILFTLTQENCGFDGLLNRTTLSPTEVCLIAELVAKACRTRNQAQSLIHLLLGVENSLFSSDAIPSTLAAMASEVKQDGSGDRKDKYEITKFVGNIIDVLLELGSRMPHAIVLISGLHTLIAEFLKSITVNKAELLANIETKMKELEDTKMSILKQMETDRLKSKRGIPSGTPPNDFRMVSVMPTFDDIFPTRLPFLRKIKATGGYSDLSEYLDVQFRLLHEDFVQPLRQGVREYLISVDNPRQHVSVRTYRAVRVLGSGFRNEWFVHTVTFDTKKLAHVQWEHSKRLIYGTLVCLSNDNFKTFSIATVESGPKQQRNTSVVTLDIFIEPIAGEREINLNIPMVMVETTAYFEAYRYVLASLQNITEGQLPFQEYIIHCKTDIKPPAYLKNQQEMKFNFDPVKNSTYVIVDNKQSLRFGMQRNIRWQHPNYPKLEDIVDEYSDGSASDVEDVHVDESNTESSNDDGNESDEDVQSVLQTDNWPKPEDVRLDEVQFKAFQQALTKEFAIIQGPPGTGKTYVGLKIVKTLLSNTNIWQQGNKSPMLVVCYTNHALDQFLEGILSFYQGLLVRVGGRCNSSKVQPYGIRNLRRTTEATRDVNVKAQKYVTSQRALLQTQKHIKVLNDGIIKCAYLLPFINKDHCKQLGESDDDVLLLWLKLQIFVHHIEKDIDWDRDGNGQQEDNTNDSNAAKRKEESDDSESDSDTEDGEAARAEAERKVDADENFEKLFRKLPEAATDIVLLPWQKVFETNKSQQWFEDFLENILSESRMTKDDEAAVDNIWEIPIGERWWLYRLWVYELQEQLEIEMVKRQQQCIDDREEYRLAKLQTDKRIMRTRSVIGMTTSGAARYQKVLSEIKPKIIIIEEAAEILEGHVIASLSSGCQHLILIGDHQQLRPSTNVYALAKRYNLELSLFERMVKNGLQCTCLEKQHRMRPSISRIMKHIYPDLRDDESVLDYPDILGVSSNVFFINHSDPEEKNEELISHLNIFEAKYVTALCLYLIKQGYSPKTITILTTYSAQVAYLKRNMPNERFEGVRVTAVDNYQGEENDIILLSLVRSNLEGNVGFLKIDNRVCVALSRAKQGLYVIGNFDLLRKQSDLWKNIVDDLKTSGQVGNALHLYCQNHHEDSGIKASKPKDFLLAPEGGCMKPCMFKLKCGHVCARHCHPVDPRHVRYKCQIPCEKIIPVCGHTQTVPCCEDERYFTCVHPVLRKGRCGHETEVACHIKDSAPCLAECDTVLKCGHRCKGRCCDCIQGRLHVQCKERCSKILICGHECLDRCSLCRPCPRPCDRCPHGSCLNACGDPCTPCSEQCPWVCKDQKCTERCTDVCNRKPCDKRCPRILKCGHRCIGLCGERCPALCKRCNKDEVKTWLSGTVAVDDAVFVELEDCGHIVEVTTLDSLMRDGDLSNTIQLRQCPWCKTCIRHSLRYQMFINRTLQYISAVKRIMTEEQERMNNNHKDDLVAKCRDVESESNENKQRGDAMCRDLHEQYNPMDSIFERNAEAILHSHAVPTLEQAAAVRNQMRFLNASHRLNKETPKESFYLHQNFSYQYPKFSHLYQQFRREYDVFLKWIMYKREVFTAQEAADANSELKRLRLCLKTGTIERAKCRNLQLTDEEDQSEEDQRLKLVQQYLVDGHPFTEERQQEMETIMAGFKTHLCGLSLCEEDVAVDMPTTFTAGQWFKCTEGEFK